MMHASGESRQTSPKVQNRGTSGLTKKDLCSSKVQKTKVGLLFTSFAISLLIPLVFQSLLDCASSLVFLISTVTITDVHQVHNTGILGWMECHLWNSEFIYFGLFVSSTWNIVVLTVERFVSFGFHLALKYTTEVIQIKTSCSAPHFNTFLCFWGSSSFNVSWNITIESK